MRLIYDNVFPAIYQLAFICHQLIHYLLST